MAMTSEAKRALSQTIRNTTRTHHTGPENLRTSLVELSAHDGEHLAEVLRAQAR
jgi:hypothetical protein